MKIVVHKFGVPECIAAVVVAASAALAIAGWPSFDANWNPGIAAWVQATGSVVAIFVAIWLAHADSRRRTAERALDDVRRLSTLLVVVRQLSVSATNFHNALHSREPAEYFWDLPDGDIENAQQALAECDLFSLPSSRIATQVLLLRGYAPELARQMRRCAKTYWERGRIDADDDATAIIDATLHLVGVMAQELDQPGSLAKVLRSGPDER